VAASNVATPLAPRHGRHTPRRDRSRVTRRATGVLVAAVAVAVAVASLVIVLTPAAQRPPARPTPQLVVTPRSGPLTPLRAELTLPAGVAWTPVPPSFLGISTEYRALPDWTRRIPVESRVLSLLHVPGDPPLVLRIGGDSSSEALWEPNLRAVPDWAVALTPAWLASTRALVQASGARLILDLNLLTASPAASAEWAPAAEAALPAGSIAGFEIGNEPDLYNRQHWLAIVSGTSLGALDLPASLSAGDYARDFRAFARALAISAPGVALLGPAIANPSRHIQWTQALLTGPHPGLKVVTAHRYPYSACAAPGSAGYPTIGRLLSEAATAGMAKSIEATVRLAHRAGLAFRLTELNSVSCGGRPGVSDTFATAPWAPDALFELLRTGADAVDVHVRPGTVNAAFSLTSRGLSARPLLYGLTLFARTLAPHSQVALVRVQGSHSLLLKAWAVRLRSGAMHVLLINKGARAVRASLRLPGYGAASVERLSAPSVSSRTGTTLDGQYLSVDGRWLGSPSTRRIFPGVAGYEVTVPRFAAALLEASAVQRATGGAPL